MTTNKILVIDDSRMIRSQIKDMLPPNNFEVVEAKNGLEGYELIQSEHPNLIMLDFLMPKMSGWEVYQEIQKNPRLKIIPLIFMSGRKDEVTEKISEPFEYFAFVEKPFDKKQLVDAIKEAMDKSKKMKKLIGKDTLTSTSTFTGMGTSGDTSATAAEVQVLKAKVETMEGEIVKLKKQINQLVTFIKQKLR